MKKAIAYEVLRQFNRKIPHEQQRRWKKRLKYALVFGVLGIVLLGGLAIWGTVVVVQKVATSVEQNLPGDPIVQGKAKLEEIAAKPLVNESCLNQLWASVVSPLRWLTEPISANIDKIKLACAASNNAPAPKSASTQSK